MNVSPKPLTIAIAAFAAIATAPSADADSTLLFPYITTSSSTYTFVSLFHSPKPPPHVASGSQNGYHNSFRISAQTRPFHSGNGCRSAGGVKEIPINAPGTLFQWELNNRFNLLADFGDNHAQINLQIPANEHGYMLVEYGGEFSASRQVTPSRLYGEAIIIDTATGMLSSYNALHVPKAKNTVDFYDYGGSEFVASWLPTQIVGTSWHVLPIGAVYSDYRTLKLSISDFPSRLSIDPQEGSAYGRNGQPFYFAPVTKTVDCFATFSTGELVPFGAGAGGWLALSTSWTSIIGKIQQSGELGVPAATMHSIPVVY